LAGLCFSLPRETKALANDHTDTSGWLVREGNGDGPRRYRDAVRDHLRLILLVTAVTTAAATTYVLVANRSYEATASLLVTPVSRVDDTLTNAGLVRDSNDPTRDVETVARLATTLNVAGIARQQLGSNRSPRSLLDDVDADPIAQSNVVAVTATASSARAAAALANAFAAAAVADRTRKFHARLDREIAGLRRELRGRATSATSDPLRDRLASLVAARSGDDPTVSFDSRADVPGGASSPKPVLSIAAGLLAGLLLGIGVALAAEALDTRLRSERQLLARFRLPLLARVPLEPRSRPAPLTPERLSPAAIDAFRTLRASLLALGEGVPSAGAIGTIVIVGASEGEGRTTVALGLAESLAAAGRATVVIEADARRPQLASKLGLGHERGLAEVLANECALADALVDSGREGLRVLTAGREPTRIPDLLTVTSARTLLEDARRHADFVVCDTPSIAAAPDALPLAAAAEHVLIAARVGRTRLDDLAVLGELVAQQRSRPTGLVLVADGGRRRHAAGTLGNRFASGPRADRVPEREPLARV
jgi:succinoglycan biosynthesis transport protein ExoP